MRFICKPFVSMSFFLFSALGVHSERERNGCVLMAFIRRAISLISFHISICLRSRGDN